jgi:excisionase family DNA binding protein
MTVIEDPLLGRRLAYRVRDAAYLLSTHEGRIYQMIRDGELPVVKIGGVMRIRREDLTQGCVHAPGAPIW